jgi:anti-sigma regulatory factor (Ser/Thr protein kinase)
VHLRAWTEADAVVVEVTDDGGELALPDLHAEPELPDPEAEQGRGLFLVRELADEVSTRVEDGHTVVRLVRHAVVGADDGGGERSVLDESVG